MSSPAILSDIRKALARSCLAAFVRYTMPGYRMGWVHEEICSELDAFLEDVVAGRSPRLMLTMPPRHGKSELASRRFPAYALGRYPDLSVISTSYAADLSSRMNRDVQRVIDSPEYRELFPGTALYGKNIRTVGNRSYLRNSDIFEVVGHAGCYRSAGVGGGITGMGGHCLAEGTFISTVEGEKKIENVAVGDVILTYDEQSCRIVPDTVVATSSRYAKDIYRLRSSSGRVLDVTGEHPIFTWWGYTAAHDLTQGDALVCLLREGVHTSSVRSHEAHQERFDGLLLLQGAFTGTPCCKEQQNVSGVRQDYTALGAYKGRQNMSGLCGNVQKAVQSALSCHRKDMSCVQQNVYGCSQKARAICNILLQALCGNWPLLGDVRTGQSSLAGRDDAIARAASLCACLSGDAASCHCQGRQCVCPVWCGRTAYRSASYRLASHEQRRCESDNALYPVSPQAARDALGTVSSGSVAQIDRVHGAVRRVYDLQLAKNHNFFANGILVHNCLIIDDPFKDRASADSPTIRQNVWDWYTSTLYTRLAPGGGILVINTRWHMADLSGRLLEAAARGEGDHWRVVNFPAIATEDEPHRRAGEALHPERYPLEQLLAIKKALGTRDWEALYQQRPTPDGGNIFKAEWLRFWLPKDLPEQFDQLLISWDMTFKDGDDTDFVVGQVWGRKGADRYLLDQVRRRMGFTDTVAAFRALAAKWPGATRKLVEDKANGPAVIDALKHAVPGIIPVEPDGSKTARAHAVTTFFEAGNVLIPHPEHCPWAREYVAELTQFPGAPHDDQCFAAGTLVATLRGGIPIEKVKEGDFVVTPQGFRRVLFAGKTGESVLLYRHGIFATANHPFMKTSGEVCKFAEIEKSELVHMTIRELLVWIFRKELNLMASPMPSWQGGNTILVSQKQTQVGKIRRGFMSLFGNTTVARKSLKGMRFITKMVIHITTILTTLSVYHVVNTAKRLSKTKKNAVSTLKKYALLLLSGTGAKKAVHGIESKAGRHTQKESILSMFVSTAARRIKRAIREKTASVPIIVKSNGDITMNTSLPRVCANGAANRSHTRPEPAEKTKYVNSAASLAAQATSTPNAVPVYNLTVEGEHLYFANGVLVHNCDATTQALRDFDVKRPMCINPAILNQPRMGRRI